MCYFSFIFYLKYASFPLYILLGFQSPFVWVLWIHLFFMYSFLAYLLSTWILIHYATAELSSAIYFRGCCVCALVCIFVVADMYETKSEINSATRKNRTVTSQEGKGQHFLFALLNKKWTTSNFKHTSVYVRVWSWTVQMESSQFLWNIR